jgi:glutamate synthase (NADPH/NADH) small chain
VLDDLQYRHIELKGIKIRPNIRIGDAIGIDDLFRDGYKAIFIGTGVWRPNALHIKGETFGNVHFAINYLNNPSVYKLGERVTIIGAGNAAMDVARTAVRSGARKVTCFSIESRVAASEYEFSYAQLEGVDFKFNLKPVEILDNGVIFRKLNEYEDGSLEEIEGSDELYESDSVIIAISQGPRNVIVSTTTGLDVNNRGLLVADELGYTSREGVFASGDVVNGARTVVEAVAHSKIVAETMHKYIQSLE